MRTHAVALAVTPHTPPGVLAGALGDLLMLAGLVVCIPFVILGVGIPIALLLQLLLWIGRLL